MPANTGINGVLLTNIVKINGVTVAGRNQNVAGAILNFGGAAATTTTTTAAGTGGSGYAVRLYGDPRNGSGLEDPSIACQVGISGFPVGPGNLYLDGVDSNLGQVTVFFDVALTTPFPGLDDNLYYYVQSIDPRLDMITLQSRQGASNGWVYLDGPCR